MKVFLRVSLLLALVVALPAFAAEDKNYSAAIKLIKSKRYGSARILLDVSLKENPTSIPVLNALAHVAEKKKDDKAALGYYRKIALIQKSKGGNGKIAKKIRKAINHLSPASGLLLKKSEALMKRAKAAKTGDEKALLQLCAKTLENFALGDAAKPPGDGTGKTGSGATKEGAAPESLTWLPPGKGLVLYYSFDKDEKGKVIDGSKEGKHGKTVGATWTENGRIGGGMEFDGKDDYLELDLAEPVTRDSISILAWIRPVVAQGVFARQGWQYDGKEYGWIVHLGSNHHTAKNNNSISWASSDKSKNYNNKAIVQTAAGVVQPEKWQFVAVTKSGPTIEIYIDGVLKKTGKIAASAIAYSRDTRMAIGESRDKYYRPSFHGTIDEVIIYNRALSGEEVKQLYEPRGP